MILEKIKKPNDLHKLSLDEFPVLADEIRSFLIKSVSETGGHLASNLGVVELTLALHNVLNFPEDKLIWDVGHQAYTHKILTGRKEAFKELRKEGGLSGFPKRKESDCDSFDTGHSSTSISAGLGYVRARDLLGQKHKIVSVIGDGALTGGMAYEALNNAAELKTNFIIVLNDNNMSISKNVGGMSTYLSALRTAQIYTGVKLSVAKGLQKIPKLGAGLVGTVRKTKSSIKQLFIPGMLFENMGLTYLGPADGHNMRQVMRLLNEAKKVEGAVVVHVLTEKGRGYDPAYTHPEKFHGTGPFVIENGEAKEKKTCVSYTDVFSETMLEEGASNNKLVAITAAMPEGTGLSKFAYRYPDRFFDVGIAEEHAVTYAAGMALGGLIPVFAVYSSFLQRSVDQILHDVCMQDQHVVFAIDRAGFVGADGETHHGCFDLSYLRMMPNMTIMAPKNAWELKEMIKAAINGTGPIAVRYPKGDACTKLEEFKTPLVHGKSEVIYRGDKIALLAVGSMVEVCNEAALSLKKRGIEVTLINVRYVKPADTQLLDSLSEDHEYIFTVEENVKSGGYGEYVSAYYKEHDPEMKVTILGVEDCFVEQGSVVSLRNKAGLCAEKILEKVEGILKKQ